MAFSEKLSDLRRQRGLSQEALGELVGASRQAVSKWETGQTTPEMSKLIGLARVFEISADELLGLSTENTQTVSVPVDGAHSSGYEYRSQREFFGLPLVHINLGRGRGRRAQGIIAIGNSAVGLVAVGFAACGLVSVGCASCGLIALGCLAAGLAALGSVAAGMIAVGAVAVGIYAVGGLAVGQFALGGAAIGGDFAFGGYASAKIAVGDACGGAHPFPLKLKGVEWTPADVLALIDAERLPLPRWIVGLLLRA